MPFIGRQPEASQDWEPVRLKSLPLKKAWKGQNFAAEMLRYLNQIFLRNPFKCGATRSPPKRLRSSVVRPWAPQLAGAQGSPNRWPQRERSTKWDEYWMNAKNQQFLVVLSLDHLKQRFVWRLVDGTPAKAILVRSMQSVSLKSIRMVLAGLPSLHLWWPRPRYQTYLALNRTHT